MNIQRTLVLIKGGGEIGSGVAHRLFRCGFPVAILELEKPLCVRRRVCFAEAIYEGEFDVEGVRARKLQNLRQIRHALRSRKFIPVVVDPSGAIIRKFSPKVLIDARMAKRNLGTSINEAPLVIGLGPGFTAGTDVHRVIETNRGHNLGRVITAGRAEADTGVPSRIGRYSRSRVLRAPADGIFKVSKKIGSLIEKGEIVGEVGGQKIRASISGLLRGLLRPGLEVKKGMKIGDIDPRGEAIHPHSISDKARAVAGGVLEAILSWGNQKRRPPARNCMGNS